MALTAVENLLHGLELLNQRGLYDLEARQKLLVGSWLAGTALGTVSMGIHHKLAHILGGCFDLEHSAIHTTLLPYSIDFNASAIPAVIEKLVKVTGNFK